jgi:hypothetical protein
MCLNKIKTNPCALYSWCNDTITVYKVLKLVPVDKRRSRLVSQHQLFAWKPGLNTCVDKLKKDSKQDVLSEIIRLYRHTVNQVNQSKQLNFGLHVFLDKKAAEKKASYDDNYRVVKFYAKKEDFVATGINPDKSKGAVFTKLYLSQEEYDLATRKDKS